MLHIPIMVTIIILKITKQQQQQTQTNKQQQQQTNRKQRNKELTLSRTLGDVGTGRGVVGATNSSGLSCP